MPDQRPCIALLAGGTSNEREVSLRSGDAVEAALKELGHPLCRIDPATDPQLTALEQDPRPQLAFLALHGTGAEDGHIQAQLETLGLPYLGTGPAASKLAFDKPRCKAALSALGIPMAASAPFSNTHSLRYPLMLKPMNGGSSCDMQIIDSEAAYQACWEEQQHHAASFFIEEYVAGTEVTVGIIEEMGQAKALPILELRPENRFYDYEAKYSKGKTQFIIPAEITPAQSQHCTELALLAHHHIGARDLSRSDFIIHPQNGPVFLEINTLPGLTSLSDIPAQAQAAGISFPKLISILIDTIVHRQ